jgi:hypothetical protein
MTSAQRQKRYRQKVARAVKLANPRLRAKQERRDAHERETAAKILALPDKQYGGICGDPSGASKSGTRPASNGRACQAPRGAGKFSEKPAIFAEMIEAYFPNLPKIELNCRGKPRPGWDGWGAEAED